MNTFLNNKYKDDNVSTESEPNLFDITSPYYDLDKLNYKTFRATNHYKLSNDLAINVSGIFFIEVHSDILKQ